MQIIDYIKLSLISFLTEDTLEVIEELRLFLILILKP